jgi:catechol 2,3-dioxygenase-like lactoylglutathione lyase family enzyme
MKPVLTHVALGVRDLDRSIAFYRKHVKLHVVHERSDSGMRVVWLAERQSDPDFVLVLLPGQPDATSGASSLRHFGYAVSSREEVDAAAAAARADGILALEPIYAGPIVGYFCIVSDPDGNQIEFSFGQPINPKGLPERLTKPKDSAKDFGPDSPP